MMKAEIWRESSEKRTWLRELADEATIIVPAQVQQSPAKSTALPALPRTYPVPEVATTNMLSPQNFVKYMLELRSLSIWIQKFRDKPPPNPPPPLPKK